MLGVFLFRIKEWANRFGPFAGIESELKMVK